MIQTVLGKIKKEELGFTLPHEHIVIDMRKLMSEEAWKDYHEPLRLDNRYKISSDPYYLLDNAFYSDEKTALKELELFKKAGGGTVVDATPLGIGRDPELYVRLSKQTGINIVMGCGYYTDGAHPEWIREKSAGDIASVIVSEIKGGVGATGIRPGILGEIGTSAVVTPEEWKVLEGAGRACMETGLPIHIHTSLWEENGLEICQRLTDAGVLPQKICINHIDVDIRPDYIERLLDMGVYVEFDNFGKEFFLPKRESGWLRGKFAYDMERCAAIAALTKKGYTDRLLLSNDICLKSMLTGYGGNGFAHLISNILPMLKSAGVPETAVVRMTETNPCRFLDIT